MPVQRIFGHRLHYGGKVYRNHLVELDATGKLTFRPFEGEEPFTRFMPGDVEINVISSDDGTLKLTGIPIQNI